VMRDWPRQMEERHEFSGSEAGHKEWQALFERELANPRPDMPDTVATVIAVAEAGHVSAQRALRSYATRLFEDPKADLNSLASSTRAYLVRVLNGLIPPHPQNRSDVIKNMVRDAGIRAMTLVVAARCRCPNITAASDGIL